MTERASDRPGEPVSPLSHPAADGRSEPRANGAAVVGAGEPADFWVDDAIPAATVVIVRDGPDGIETLMLKRDSGLVFAGGMWVFPGGRIDESDRGATDAVPTDADKVATATVTGEVGQPELGGVRLEMASRRAAARETAEEAGLVIDSESMVRWSHWTAPMQTPRRFTTAFYVAVIEPGHPLVTIDDGEIREFRWLPPSQVIEGHASGELGLTPPTFITLIQLVPFENSVSLIESAVGRPVEHFATRFGFIDDVMVAMYHGDAGYESEDVEAAGARHRLSMGPSWTYERDG